MNDQNIMFGYPPPMEKIENSKNVNQLTLMNVQNIILIDPFLLKEYNLCSPNNESSLEQYKSIFAFLKKVNNSIATKLRVTLLNNHKNDFGIF